MRGRRMTRMVSPTPVWFSKSVLGRWSTPATRPAPPFAALTVKVASVQIVYHDDGEILHEEPADGLGPEIFVGDHSGLLHTVGQERGRALHGAEVDATVFTHRPLHLLGTHALAYHSPQAALDQARRVRVHPRSGRRPRRPKGAAWARRGRAGKVDHLPLRVERQRLPSLDGLLHAGVGRVARGVEDPVEAHDVAAPQWLYVARFEGRLQADGLDAHSSTEEVRWEWQSRFTATGKAAMWVGKLSTWTASAVTVPP